MTAITRWPYKHPVPKDPDSTLDYTLDWSDWLAGDETIVESTWTLSGVTSVNESRTTTTTTIFVRGGTVGETASLTNRITTSNAVPRIDERTLLLSIQER